MRLGVTGHQRLEVPASWNWVRKELDRLLLNFPQSLVGITSLAVGADQLFANAILERGGTLEVIVPFNGYESTFSEGRDRHMYLDLLRRAAKVDVLKKDGTNQEAYLASGKAMVDRSELIIAVWDGKPALGLGGTGEIVEYALQQHKRTVQFNPIKHEILELD